MKEIWKPKFGAFQDSNRFKNEDFLMFEKEKILKHQLFGLFELQYLLDELRVHEICLEQGVEITCYIFSIYHQKNNSFSLFPMFFSPTGTPFFLCLSTGFNVSTKTFCSWAVANEAMIALFTSISSSWSPGATFLQFSRKKIE